MSQQLILSASSLGPLVAGKEGPKTLQGYAKRAKIDLVSLAPFQAWDLSMVKDMFIDFLSADTSKGFPKVFSYEVPSRLGMSSKVDQLSISGIATAYATMQNWADLFFYGKRMKLMNKLRDFKTSFPNANGIDAGSSSFLRTVPQNGIYENVYFEHPQGVAFDTKGARRILPVPDKLGRNPPHPEGFFEQLIENEKVKVVIFRPASYNEFYRFLEDETEGDRLLFNIMKLAHLHKLPVIIDLPWWWISKAPDLCLKEARDRILR